MKTKNTTKSTPKKAPRANPIYLKDENNTKTKKESYTFGEMFPYIVLIIGVIMVLVVIARFFFHNPELEKELKKNQSASIQSKKDE